MHERVHEADRESRGDVRIEYNMSLRSFQLGVVGKADVVEFHRQSTSEKKGLVKWLPFPVEYKRGKPKKDNYDKVQLCAQGMCLEEMLNIEVPEGALFYGKTRRRQDVIIDNNLRKETEDAAKRLHELFNSGRTPGPVYGKKCDTCSFISLCLPKTFEKKSSVSSYLANAAKE